MITIEKHEELNWADPAFYCWTSPSLLVTVSNGLSTREVLAVGEMRIAIPSVHINADGTTELTNGQIIRYCDDLISAGIDTDHKLSWLNKMVSEVSGYEMWHNNNWFEVVDPDEEDGWNDSVFHDLEEAIEYAKAELTND